MRVCQRTASRRSNRVHALRRAGALLVVLLFVAGSVGALTTSVPTTRADDGRAFWQVTGDGVVVAVLDTGVDDEHPDLTGKFLAGTDLGVATPVPGCEFNPDDLNGHGTHVASTALGRAGVAPGALLVDVKISTDPLSGASLLSGLARGVDWVVEYNAGTHCAVAPEDKVDVVSISFTTKSPGSPTDLLAQAIGRAVAAGIVVVVAAGNCGPSGESSCETRGDNSITSPGMAPAAITVAAADDAGTAARDDDTFAAYSSRGPCGAGGTCAEKKPDLTAPGSNVAAACYASVGAAKENGCSKTGTSMAAPHVTGAVALLLDAKPTLTPAEVKDVLARTAEKRTGLAWDPFWGHGYLDVRKALDAVLRVNLAPVARVGVGGCAPPRDFCLRFDAGLSNDPDGNISSYRWTFSNGATSPNVVEEVNFTVAGTYEAVLTVTDDEGATSVARVNATAVELPRDQPPNRAPRAALVASPANGTTQTVVEFDAQGSSDEDGTIFAVSWDFGDGATAATSLVQYHQYARPGRYNASVTVYDDEGVSSTASAVVVVRLPEQAPPPEGDARAPVVRITTPRHGEEIPEGPFKVAWAVDEPASVAVALDGRPAGVTSEGSITVRGLPGLHLLRVVATDAAGNTGSDEVQFEVFTVVRAGENGTGSGTDDGSAPPERTETPLPALLGALAVLLAALRRR